MLELGGCWAVPRDAGIVPDRTFAAKDIIGATTSSSGSSLEKHPKSAKMPLFLLRLSSGDFCGLRSKSARDTWHQSEHPVLTPQYHVSLTHRPHTSVPL